MGITLSNKAVYSIAKTYAAAVAMSAISNAAEAVATLADGHGVVVGDYVEVTSGWGGLNGRVVRAKAVNVDAVTLESVDTSDVIHFPAGGGVGTVRKISAWDNLSQIEDVQTSGGDQQYDNNTWLDDDEEREIPTTRSAQKMSVTVTDDPSLPWVATVQAADNAKTPVGLRITFANGSKLVGNVFLAMQRVPSVAKNKSLKSKLDFAFSAKPIRYAT